MNNLRLLTGLLAAALSGSGACVYSRTPVSLEEIFEIAEANSARLRPSFTSEAEAREEINVARAGRLPDINASLSFSYIGDGFTTKRNLSDYQRAPIPHFGNGLSLNITQPVYTGGAVTSAIEMAELKSTAARYATDFQRDNIRFQLAGFYLDIYKYDNLRHVVESNITAARKVLQEMHARYDQGTVLKNDITRYELLVSNLELQLVRINNTIDILNTNLVTVAGLPEGTVVVPDTTILTRALPKEDAGWWRTEAETHSPALSLARSSIEISRKSEDLVRAERLPKIGLQAGWTIDGPILTEIPPINRNLSYWYVGVGISYNLSSLWHANRKLSAGRARTRQAVRELEATRTQLEMDVRADYIKYLESYQELKTRDKGVELAVRNYNTISTRYNEGMALITDQVDAANARLEAEQNLVNARINIIYSYYKLLFTTGEI